MTSVQEIVCKNPIAALVIAAIIGIVIYTTFFAKKGSEGFVDLPMRDMNVPPSIYSGVPMKPSLIPAIPPRFDGQGLNGNPLLSSGVKPPLPFQAAPAQPVITKAEHFQQPADFSMMGSTNAPVPSGALTSQQAADMLNSRMGSQKPEMQKPEDLMPVPDMSYSAGVDPTDPQAFMYDRTIFSRLKRRYGNGVDFFRGDIDVSPEYRGWFDVQPPTDIDVVNGYFDRYIDIQQETAIKDATFTRATPVEQLFKNAINPFGDTNKTAYSRI